MQSQEHMASFHTEGSHKAIFSFTRNVIEPINMSDWPLAHNALHCIIQVSWGFTRPIEHKQNIFKGGHTDVHNSVNL